MKQKMVIVFLLCTICAVAAVELQPQEIQGYYDDGIELLLSRLDYGISYAFLPYSLAMALAVMENYPVEYEVLAWDADNEVWLVSYNFYLTYTDGYLTSLVMSMSMPGYVYDMSTEYSWEGELLTATLSTITLNGETSVHSRETITYNNEGLFESLLLEGWQVENEMWINLERTNSTIEDGKITVMLTEEFDYDNMIWEMEERLTYTWEGELVTSQLEEYHDGSGWYNNDMHYMYYHDNGLMDYILIQIWNGSTWEDEHKVTYTYEGELHTYNLTEKWDESVWVYDEQEFITYDDQQRPVLNHEDEYIENEWVNDNETHFSYTAGIIEDEILPSAVDWNIYPNPFNPNTKISWQVNISSMPETMNIYNVRGRKIAELDIETSADGRGELNWNGRNFASGIYYFKLAGFEKCCKGILLK